MISHLSPDAKIPTRFAPAPWNEHTDLWRQLEAQLPHDPLARESRNAMAHLDLTHIDRTYSGRGKAPTSARSPARSRALCAPARPAPPQPVVPRHTRELSALGGGLRPPSLTPVLV